MYYNPVQHCAAITIFLHLLLLCLVATTPAHCLGGRVSISKDINVLSTEAEDKGTEISGEYEEMILCQPLFYVNIFVS